MIITKLMEVKNPCFTLWLILSQFPEWSSLCGVTPQHQQKSFIVWKSFWPVTGRRLLPLPAGHPPPPAGVEQTRAGEACLQDVQLRPSLPQVCTLYCTVHTVHLHYYRGSQIRLRCEAGLLLTTSNCDNTSAFSSIQKACAGCSRRCLAN